MTSVANTVGREVEEINASVDQGMQTSLINASTVENNTREVPFDQMTFADT